MDRVAAFFTVGCSEVLSERGGPRCSARHFMLEHGVCDCELIFSSYVEEFLTVVVGFSAFGEFS